MSGLLPPPNAQALQETSWIGGTIVFTLVVFLWTFMAEMIRRSFGRRGMWVATILVALAVSVYLLVIVRPRVAAQPEHPLAFAAIPLMVMAIFVAPSFALERGARRVPAPFLRQLGLGTVVGVGTELAGFLVTYLVAHVLP